MRLSVLLTLPDRYGGGDGPRLATGLHQLARALDRMDRLVIIDTGTQDDMRAHLRVFAEGPGRGAHILFLDPGAVVPATARALARRETGAEYVLELGARDLLCAGATAALEAQLEETRPEVMICPHGWWVAGPSSGLPGPDAARLAAPVPAERYPQLFADPRRLLPRDPETEERCRQAVQAGNPGQGWACYEAVLGEAATVALAAGPVLLRPLPDCRAAAAVSAARAALEALPARAARGPALAQLLPRIFDELTQVDPANTDAVVAAARMLVGALPWRARRALRRAPVSAPGTEPAAQLLAAAAAGDQVGATTLVAQLAAARDRACMRALSGEIGQLRTDLDRALPGPDYLMELYERVRPR